jgi:hypothetical protein
MQNSEDPYFIFFVISVLSVAKCFPQVYELNSFMLFQGQPTDISPSLPCHFLFRRSRSCG